VGRIPLVQGWKAVYSASEPDAASDETERTLPPLTDGEIARLAEPRVDAKRTQAPPRYNEGTLIDAMQNAWRFVENPSVRERLKEAKGIGTPATRAEGLKKQNLLAADGKWVLPTSAGLQLFEELRDAAPALVDPGTTAEWEMQLDAVVTGKADHRRVIDAIAVEAEKLIGVLQRHEQSTLRPRLPRRSRESGVRAGLLRQRTRPQWRNHPAARRLRLNPNGPAGVRLAKRETIRKLPRPHAPLRPPAWSLMRRSSPRRRSCRCLPATRRISKPAAVSSTSTVDAVFFGADGQIRLKYRTAPLSLPVPALYVSRCEGRLKELPLHSMDHVLIRRPA
jgi:DNA topoisomerase-3